MRMWCPFCSGNENEHQPECSLYKANYDTQKLILTERQIEHLLEDIPRASAVVILTRLGKLYDVDLGPR